MRELCEVHLHIQCITCTSWWPLGIDKQLRVWALRSSVIKSDLRIHYFTSVLQWGWMWAPDIFEIFKWPMSRKRLGKADVEKSVYLNSLRGLCRVLLCLINLLQFLQVLCSVPQVNLQYLDVMLDFSVCCLN